MGWYKGIKNFLRKMTKKEELLLKLKKVSLVYAKANNEQRIRLFNACGDIFNKLVSFGMERSLVEALVVGGRDFVETLGDGETDESGIGCVRIWC